MSGEVSVSDTAFLGVGIQAILGGVVVEVAGSTFDGALVGIDGSRMQLLHVVDSSFSGGGGISGFASTILVERSRFTGSSGVGAKFSDVLIDDSTFVGNRVGLALNGDHASVSNSRFVDNGIAIFTGQGDGLDLVDSYLARIGVALSTSGPVRVVGSSLNGQRVGH